MFRRIMAITLIAIFAFPGVAVGKTLKSQTGTSQDKIIAKTPGAPDIKAKGAVLIDASSGQILYGLNMNTPLPPASTTKILTGIIGIERSNLDETVTISDTVRTVDGTHIALLPGEKAKMKDLLYALLLNSANDAAVGIAEHVAGSVEKFSVLMNETALELGAKNSNFVNPNGLPNPKHYTSAYDLAMITRYAMNNQMFRQIVGTPSYEMNRERPNAQRFLSNHNKLIQPNSYYRYPGATGVKTGYTIQARQCIVASAKRDNREYIAVVLGAENIWEGPTKLLDYAFNNFSSVDVIQPGEFVKSINVENGSEKVSMISKTGFSFSMPKDENKLPEKKVILNKGLKAPIKAGQILGHEEYFYKGEKIGLVDLVAKNSIKQKSTAGIKFGVIIPIGVGGIFLAVLLNIYRSKTTRIRRRKMKRPSRLH